MAAQAAGAGQAMTDEAARSLEERCAAKGLRMTDQRRVIARVIGGADDHPDVEEIHRRASAIDPGISLATVYRTVRLFEDSGLLSRHDFGDGRARFETLHHHHDHLIDITTGAVIEFQDPALHALLRRIADELGFHLVKHRLELIGRPIDGRAGGANGGKRSPS